MIIGDVGWSEPHLRGNNTAPGDDINFSAFSPYGTRFSLEFTSVRRLVAIGYYWIIGPVCIAIIMNCNISTPTHTNFAPCSKEYNIIAVRAMRVTLYVYIHYYTGDDGETRRKLNWRFDGMEIRFFSIATVIAMKSVMPSAAAGWIYTYIIHVHSSSPSPFGIIKKYSRENYRAAIVANNNLRPATVIIQYGQGASRRPRGVAKTPGPPPSDVRKAMLAPCTPVRR